MPSKIEWTDETWNPVTGCSKISGGCQNCYAERMSHRLAGRFGYPKMPNQFKPTFHQDKLTQPLVWKKPRRIFVCSMGDLFHDDVNVDWIDSIMGIINQCHQHTFILLTKRPENIEEKAFAFYHNGGRKLFDSAFPKNVWLGATTETQSNFMRRITDILKLGTHVRFISAEPLLSPLNISWALKRNLNGCELNCTGTKGMCRYHSGECSSAHDNARGLDWVICGAETGPGKRRMDLDWARSLRDQCQEEGVPFFFKKDSDGNHELDGLVWEQYPKG